ncbi:MAG: polysaccharide biosynthesis C-terminal domain-containing protein [Acidimicrobiales bacterium]
MSRVSGALRAARDSKITRNAGWLLAGELFGLASQLVMFILVTNTFDSDVYGTFVGVVSLALFVGPFSSFGAGYLVVQRVVSKGEALVPAVLRAWTTVIIGAVVIGGILVAFRGVVLPQASTILLIEILIAELFFNQLVQANRFIGQAIDKLWLTPVMTATSGVMRVLFAVWYLRVRSNPTIEGWGVFYVLSVAVGAVVGIAIIWFMVGDEIKAKFPSRRDLGEGLTFSINVSSAMLKGDADKWLLLRMNEAAANGVYGAGYRILGLATVPNTALGDATYARFFSASGPKEAIALAKRLSAVSLVLNTVSGVTVIVFASFITGLLGSSYSEAAEVLRWIAFVPMLSAWQLFAGNALSGIGHHRTRLYQTMSSAGLNIVLNIILIPSMSWRGSAVATIVTELYLVVLHWRSLWLLAARDDAPASAMAAATT